MGWGLAIGAAIAAAGTAYSASQQKKAAAQRNAALKDGVQELEPVELPDAERVNARKTALNYIDTLGDYSGYASRIADFLNQYQLSRTLGGYRRMQPFFSQIQQQVGQNALDMARGELPSDVQNQITRMAAEKGIQGGYGYGSQGAKGGALANLNLRNLGLTSLDMAKYGSELGLRVNQQAAALTPKVINPMELFARPEQFYATEQFNVGQANQFTLAENNMLNQAALQNTSLQNNLATALAQNDYQSALQQAQAVQQIASIVGGAAGKMGQSSMPTYTQRNDASAFNTLSGGTNDTWRQNATGAFTALA